ncbi:hypothetical protein HWI79_739 [Cryptosporidium felis]|nr:hypothetical protein HWI79_739 [Cryptosporidium felis]
MNSTEIIFKNSLDEDSLVENWVDGYQKFDTCNFQNVDLKFSKIVTEKRNQTHKMKVINRRKSKNRRYDTYKGQLNIPDSGMPTKGGRSSLILLQKPLC